MLQWFELTAARTAKTFANTLSAAVVIQEEELKNVMVSL